MIKDSPTEELSFSDSISIGIEWMTGFGIHSVSRQIMSYEEQN